MNAINHRSNPVDNTLLSNALTCPILKTPLKDAVLLLPCCHTISEVAATHLYHGIHQVNGENSVKNQAPCALCSRNVTAYYPNHIMRSLVELMLGIKSKEDLPTTSAIIQPDKEKNLDDIPFPGVGAHFVLASGDWNFFDSGGDLIREMTFVSKTKDSVFKKMSVLGYYDGSIAISINFEKNNKIVGDYLSECGINLDFVDIICGFYKSNFNDTELLFRILAKHNYIPADKFSLIRNLVAKGNWKID